MAPPIDVLVVAPHPDDAEITCGGTIARLVKNGSSVAVIDLTRGELSTRGDVETRAKEAQEASKVLGISVRRNLSLPDGGITASDAHTKAVVRVLRELRPKMVLFPPSEERHPDHVATHELVRRAIFLSGLPKFNTEGQLPKFTPKYAFTYMMRYETNFSFLVDISDVYETKLKAIRCFGSQVFTGKTESKEEQSFISTEQAFRAFEAPSAFYGSMIGVAHAEPLTYIGALGVRDPLGFMERECLGNLGNQYLYPKSR